MKHKRNLLIGIALSATAGFLALQSVNAPTAETVTPDASEDCYFVWAQQDDMELSERLDAAVRAMDERANANAMLFGEDCVYADGTSRFGVMETDFYVRREVDDLADDDAFGDWIRQVMTVILELPPEEIQGPQPGFVEFRFIKLPTEQIIVRVPIEQYKSEAQGKTGAELFRMFYEPP